MRKKSWKLLIKYSVFTILFIYIIIVVLLALFRKHDILHTLTQNCIKEPQAKKDWHDWYAIQLDYRRVGLGELGKPATLGNNTDRVLEAKLRMQHGLNVLLSDAISVNRSVLDTRVKGCFFKKYLSKLPTVSIIIPFHNELLSTFARTLHSLINRTPSELLKEIILVDDFSDLDFFEKLEKYVASHFTKVRFVRMPERMGLIRARLAGIRKMTAEVFVILDAHIEVGYNWLPPLIEPIALNKRTVVCPFVDWIVADDLHFHAAQPRQGAFDWTLTYAETVISSKDLRNSTEPYPNPIMIGGLFAMSPDYFWELGGYDEGLKIWGAEQYDLSFKVWMCSDGQILNAPCSRVGHHFRGSVNKGIHAKDEQFLIKNKKRVVEVWLDDYKKYFYERHYSYVEQMDVGDLTKQKALREKLHCKTFDWYMKEIAENILKAYPPVQPLEYAVGAIQSVGSPSLCIDHIGGRSTPALYTCANNLQKPHENQMFLLRWSRDLRSAKLPCFDVPKLHKNAPVILFACHNRGGTQFWYYDRMYKWLVNRPRGVYCLEAFPQNMSLFMNICDVDNVNMKWNFGAVNDTALDSFYENFKI